MHMVNLSYGTTIDPIAFEFAKSVRSDSLIAVIWDQDSK